MGISGWLVLVSKTPYFTTSCDLQQAWHYYYDCICLIALGLRVIHLDAAPQRAALGDEAQMIGMFLVNIVRLPVRKFDEQRYSIRIVNNPALGAGRKADGEPHDPRDARQEGRASLGKFLSVLRVGSFAQPEENSVEKARKLICVLRHND